MFSFISYDTIRCCIIFIKNLLMQQDKNDLSVINSQTRQRDLTYFESIWYSTQCQMRQKLKFLCSNWEIQNPFQEKKLENFQDLVTHKFSSVDQFKNFFPQLGQVVTQLERVNQYKSKQKKISFEKPITDELFYHFLKDVSTKKDRNGMYYIKSEKSSQISKQLSKKPLHQYIGECLHFCISEKMQARWQNIFSRVEKSIQFEAVKKPSSASQVKQGQLFVQFTKEIEKQRMSAIDCLGCCPFFYAGTNIYNPGINSTPLVLLSSVGRIRELQTQLKDEVCWLLNNHGGVIMFDCAVRYMDVVPVGDIMSRHLKVEIGQTIQSYIKCIEPPVQAANFTITFVPIVKNPLTEGLREGINVLMEGATYENTYYRRQFVEGFFVTRIKITPTVPERVYFWINDQRPIFPKKIDGKIVATSGQRIHRLLKRRFKDYYVAENARNRVQLLFMRPKLSYFHEGECKQPQAGVQVNESRRQCALLNFEEIYPYLSLVLARRCDLATIRQRLQKRGIACEIETRFERNKFKYAMNSAILYHSLRFDLLLKQIAYQKEFEFAGKFITILCVTPFIKLIDRGANNHLPQESFENMQNYFSQEYPEENIRLWKYTTQYQTEFYFKVSKPIRTVYLYYILNQLGQKASLKNPKNFDKLSEGDINTRFKLHYPRNQLNMEGSLKAKLKL